MASIPTDTASTLLMMAAKTMREAAGADRAELVTRGELYRALWIQGAGIVTILTALRFLPI